MDSLSIAQKIIKANGARLEFLVLKNKEGKKNFFYVVMTEEKASEMQKKIANGSAINPEDFGMVLVQGVGESPSEELENLINEIFEIA